MELMTISLEHKHVQYIKNNRKKFGKSFSGWVRKLVDAKMAKDTNHAATGVAGGMVPSEQ